MADVKFSELSSLTATASADVLAIVDSSESASKQLSIDNLFGAVPVNLAITDLTQSTSNTTGSITTTGGMGIGRDAFIGGSLDVDGTTNLDAVDIDGAVQIDGTLAISTASKFVVPSTSASPKTVKFPPTTAAFEIPIPPVVVIDPVVLLVEFVVSIDAILTGIAPNRLSIDSCLEVLALVSTIAITSADAKSEAASVDNSENFTSAMNWFRYESSSLDSFSSSDSCGDWIFPIKKLQVCIAPPIA